MDILSAVLIIWMILSYLFGAVICRYVPEPRVGVRLRLIGWVFSPVWVFPAMICASLFAIVQPENPDR